MALHDSFDVLSDVLREYRSRGRAVRSVDVTTAERGGTALRVALEVPVSLCASTGDGLRPELTPETATLTDDGALRVELSSADLAPVPSTHGAVVSADERSVGVDDGDLVLTVDLTVDPAAAGDGSGPDVEEGRPVDDDADGTAPDGGETGGATAGDEPGRSGDLAAVRDESVPPYEDTEYLRALYDACDSFAEMSREIAMDVSAETVRRYMIEADVHEPTTYDTSSEGGSSPDRAPSSVVEGDPDGDDGPSGSSGSPSRGPATDVPDERLVGDVPDEQLVTDGSGLPANLDLSDVADAVVESRTTYEVHRHLGIGQERTRDLLKQLNLHDLVLRRVGGDPDRRVSYEEVAARIRQCVPREA